MASQRFRTGLNRAEKRLTRANRHAVRQALKAGNWESLPPRKRILTCPYGKGCCASF